MSKTRDQRRLKEIEVSGTPYEMGFQYGRACPEINKVLDVTYQMFGGWEAAIAIADKYMPMYLPPAETYASEIVDEMKGIAAGVKVDFRDIFLLNTTYEISAPLSIGCTSFAAIGEATSHGELIIGQNFDFLSTWEEIIVLLGPRCFLRISSALIPWMAVLYCLGCNNVPGRRRSVAHTETDAVTTMAIPIDKATMGFNPNSGFIISNLPDSIWSLNSSYSPKTSASVGQDSTHLGSCQPSSRR